MKLEGQKKELGELRKRQKVGTERKDKISTLSPALSK
jgi:hypothetical protein